MTAIYLKEKPRGMSWEAWRRYRECTSKRKRRRGEARREAHNRGQRAYECSYCGCWHLTKATGETR